MFLLPKTCHMVVQISEYHGYHLSFFFKVRHIRFDFDCLALNGAVQKNDSVPQVNRELTMEQHIGQAGGH